jgi:hypothetical protein
MNIVRLEGLTPLQVELCQHIWTLDTEPAVTAWLETLPRSIRQQALSILYLITVECIDQDPITDFSLAQAVIERVR